MAVFISNTAIGANTSNVSASELAKVEAEAKKVTKEQKEYVFDIQNVEKFINLSIELISDDLNKILYS